VAKELADALDGLQGPFILSDRRLPDSDCVFYRYGGFQALPRLQPDGSKALMITDDHGKDYADVRNPFYSKPAWVIDPFDEPQPKPGLPQLNNGRYAISAALAYSNAGGVYRATDRHTGLEVVIKEARPHILVGRKQLAAQDILVKEYEILTLLAETDRFAQPVELFTEWEHCFLVEQFIDGEQMSSQAIRANPLVNRRFDRSSLIDYYAGQQKHWLGILDALAGAHARDVLVADLSFTNVLVDESNQIKLIDLEAAVRIGRDQPLGFYTPGVSNIDAQYGEADLASDYYGLGALMLGSIMLINNAVGYNPASLPSFLDQLAQDMSLPTELVSIVYDLMRPAPDQHFNPQALHNRIAAIDFTPHPAWQHPVPISLPATHRDGLTAAQIEEIVARTADQIKHSADPDRSDRLFPTYLMAYETNTLSLAYGAAGVLHVLHEIDGDVPDRMLTWLLAADWTDPEACPPGLYSGVAEIAWVLDELGQPELARRALTAAMNHPLVYADPGIHNGLAGIGLACLRLGHTSDDPAFASQAMRWALDCGEQLLRRMVIDERGAHWPAAHSLRSTTGSAEPTPIGYAYGASGISLFLLYLSLATGDPEWLRLGRRGLDFDLSWSYQLDAGFVQFPAKTHDPEESPAVIRSYWDEGTAGVATALLRYRAVEDDVQLQRMWQLMRPDLCRKYTVLPQLFHGLAGIGMALLDAAELIGDDDARLEAGRLAKGLSLYAVAREQGLAWPSEQCYRESSDLATGAAGVAMFFNRLRHRSTRRTSNTNFVLDDLLLLSQVHH